MVSVGDGTDDGYGSADGTGRGWFLGGGLMGEG